MLRFRRGERLVLLRTGSQFIAFRPVACEVGPPGSVRLTVGPPRVAAVFAVYLTLVMTAIIVTTPWRYATEGIDAGLGMFLGGVVLHGVWAGRNDAESLLELVAETLDGA